MTPVPYSSQDGRVEIKNSIPIYLNQYRDIANQVNSEFYSPTELVDLSVYYNISALVSNQQGDSASQVCPYLTIPIKGNIFIVNGELSAKKDNAIIVKKMVEVPGAKNSRQIAVAATIFSVFLLLLVIYATRAEIEEPAITELRQIMKKHGERIAAGVFNLPADLKSNMIIMHSFYDLVKVADEASQPILYETSLDGVHSFYVINKPLTYLYSLQTSVLKNINQIPTAGTKEINI